MGDQERNLYPVENAVEVDVLGDAHELIHVAGAPNPADMVPIVRDGKVALALQSLLLHVAPVVVGAPDDAVCAFGATARADSSNPRAETPSMLDGGFHVDIVARLQPIDDAACPDLRNSGGESGG